MDGCTRRFTEKCGEKQGGLNDSSIHRDEEMSKGKENEHRLIVGAIEESFSLMEIASTGH